MAARFPLPRRTRTASACRFRPSVLALEGRDLPSTLTVTNLLDSGAGSLRAEIAAAASGDTINFAASVRGTITLTSGELLLNKGLTITGPGAGLLTVSGNHASRVFEVAAGKTDHISGLTVADGMIRATPTASGGGILSAGTLTLTNCTVSGNTVEGDGNLGTDGIGYGGGIASTGTLILTDCTVSGNTTTGKGAYDPRLHQGSNGHAYGGGFYSTGTLTVTASTVANNTSVIGPSGGGGNFINNGGGGYVTGATTLTNSTLASNSALVGSGIEVAGGTTTLTSCTVTRNSGSPFGAAVNTDTGATTRLRNSIVALNPDPPSMPSTFPDVNGTIASLGYNLIGAPPNGRTGWLASDLTGTPSAPLDPRLGSLANNGGPTQTLRVLPGSPAIGAGDPALASTTDQRGVARHNPPSIGAFEYTPPTTFTVTTLADGGAGSLRDALSRAAAYDIVAFAPALSGGTITLASGELLLAHSVTIQGLGSGSLTVSGGYASRVFEVTAGAVATISGLTIANGWVADAAAHGGGILNHGGLTLSNCVVTGNVTASADPNGQSQGGGIYNDASGTLTLTGDSVDGNLAYATGGDASSTGSANGGGLYSLGGSVTLSGCDVSGNYAYADGGGTRPAWGGGLTADGGTLTLTVCTVNGNAAVGTAGATGSGGGLHAYNTQTVSLTNCTLDSNYASTDGGGASSFGVGFFLPSFLLQGCTLAYNYAGVNGGGVAAEGAQYSLVSTASLINCTLAYNYAGLNGGGAYAEPGPSGVVGNGVGLTSCTVAYNYAGGSGGGLFVGDSALGQLSNTLVADNGAGMLGPDVAGRVLSGGFNLIGITDGSTGWGQSSIGPDLTGTAASPLDPRLGDLADNGGPTQTIALLAGSPAIGAGGDGAGSTDQRGVARHNPSCIGAYEF